MGKNSVPDRWECYSNIGSVIPGTRFVAFKVPLKKSLLNKVPEDCDRNWCTEDLLASCPKPGLGLVIDLTFTTRYYSRTDFDEAGVSYQKIPTMGHVIPNKKVMNQFYTAVDGFLEKSKDKLIGVHCTHGLNRTGYLICRYMIEKLKTDPKSAIEAFNAARGHEQERENYLESLRTQDWNHPSSDAASGDPEDNEASTSKASTSNDTRQQLSSSRRQQSHYAEDSSGAGQAPCIDTRRARKKRNGQHDDWGQFRGRQDHDYRQRGFMQRRDYVTHPHHGDDPVRYGRDNWHGSSSSRREMEPRERQFGHGHRDRRSNHQGHDYHQDYYQHGYKNFGDSGHRDNYYEQHHDGDFYRTNTSNNQRFHPYDENPRSRGYSRQTNRGQPGPRRRYIQMPGLF